MIKKELQTLKTKSKDFSRELEIKALDKIELKETKTLIVETVAVRDFSGIFARLKKCARRKSAGIL